MSKKIIRKSKRAESRKAQPGSLHPAGSAESDEDWADELARCAFNSGNAMRDKVRQLREQVTLDERRRADQLGLACSASFSRVWSMATADTFDIPEIRDFVLKYLQKSICSIDPFARNKRWATWTNDINPATAAKEHLEARRFLRQLELNEVQADLVLFDPPYSPRQIQEHYAAAHMRTNQEDTQNAKLYAECRNYFRKLTTPNAVVLSFGWNSVGMGKGWDTDEIMLVCHGGAHNDTICLAERKRTNLQGVLLS